MKRRISFVLALMLLAVMFAGCAGETTSADVSAATAEQTTGQTTDASTEEPPAEQMTFKWSIATAADHKASIITQEICDQIYAETNGVIKVELYAANALGSEAEATDMIRSGAILGGTIGQQMFEPYLTDISGWMLPYTFKSAEALGAFMNDYAMENVWNDEMNAATGITFLGASCYGLRHLTTKGVEVHSPADLSGVEVRSMEQPVSIAYVTALGGNAVPIAWSELYMALQTGTVAGQENPISNIIAGKFYEVQDYLVLTGHAGGVALACVNDAVFATIPAEYQQIVKDAFAAGSLRITEEVLAAEAASIEELKSKGMTVLTADDIDFDAFVSSAATVVADQFGGAEYDSWREYQEMAMDWCEENGY